MEESVDFAPQADEDASFSGESQSAPSQKTSTSQPADDFSTTNIQVEGVDEGDIIKNDGKYIYMIKGGAIRIIDAYPSASMQELVSVQFADEQEDFSPRELYLNGDQLIVIGQVGYQVIQEKIAESYIWPPYNYRQRLKTYILDVSDRAAPSVTRTVEFDGYLNTSRRVGDHLYIILNHSVPSYIYSDPTQDLSEEFSDTLPQFKDSATEREQLIAPCEDIHILPRRSPQQYFITAAIPLTDDQAEIGRAVVVGSSNTVYASQDNLYVTTDGYSPFRNYSKGQETKIYRFSLDDENIEFQAQGSVPGRPLNQFSLDEHQNNLRIATTDTSYASGTTDLTNNLYILNPDLEQIGSITNIAPGEKIYSARFMGDRGYLVTFKRVDPLFVFDLQDPTNPTILGELKIPGFSDYLHPYDENHLIGFGKDVDPDQFDEEDEFVFYEAVRGFKMGLFDVTDPTKPQEIATEIIGDRGTYSELLNNHKALLFDREKNLLAFPITVQEIDSPNNCRDFTYSTCPSDCNRICLPTTCTYENGIEICTTDCDGPDSCVEPAYQEPQTTFIGAYVYGVTPENGFVLRGKISNYSQDELDQIARQGYPELYDKAIDRLLYIGDSLYTVATRNIKAFNLQDLQPEAEILVGGENYRPNVFPVEPLFPIGGPIILE